MENEIIQYYKDKMRATFIEGGYQARVALIAEMKNLAEEGKFALEDIHRIYFSVMPPMGT
jgi:hypothetical protein